MGTSLIACPSCSCHAFAREVRCPKCGALLRGADGAVQRTAGAVLLGLSLSTAVTAAACGNSTSTGGQGGGASTTSSSGFGGFQAVTAYGTGPSSGSFSSSSTTGSSSTSGGTDGGGDGG